MDKENDPIFRISKLQVKKADQEAFVKEQEAELENTIPAEANSLLFASGHDNEEQENNYVVELYRNPKAWEVHSAADYYDHYDQVMHKLTKSNQLYDLKPEWITTHSRKALNSHADNFVMRLAKVELNDGQHDQFAAIAKKEMRRAIAQEPGAEILMAGSNRENENEWLFFAVYANGQAYDQHLKTKWYQQYLKDSEKLVKDKKLRELSRDVMAVQGPIVVD